MSSDVMDKIRSLEAKAEKWDELSKILGDEVVPLLLEIVGDIKKITDKINNYVYVPEMNQFSKKTSKVKDAYEYCVEKLDKGEKIYIYEVSKSFDILGGSLAELNTRLDNLSYIKSGYEGRRKFYYKELSLREEVKKSEVGEMQVVEEKLKEKPFGFERDKENFEQVD